MTVRVDVGGYRLAADVTAGKDPATLFISGRGDGRAVWADVLSLLGNSTATITYDRAGIGESDPRPRHTPLPYSALADELMTLLHGLSVTGPIVVVAHSLGALVARSLATRHPALIAGLVLVDGSVDECALWQGITTFDGTSPETTLLDYQTGAAELARAQSPVVPSAVITRTPGRPWPGAPDADAVDRRWTRHQRAMADRLNAVLLVANDSGHYIQHDAVELVVLAVNAVVSAVVAGDGVVELDPGQAAAAGGVLAR